MGVAPFLLRNGLALAVPSRRFNEGSTRTDKLDTEGSAYCLK